MIRYILYIPSHPTYIIFDGDTTHLDTGGAVKITGGGSRPEFVAESGPDES